MPVTNAWDRPRLRQDLVAEVVEEAGTKFIDVGDPENGQMFRFYEVEFSIACGMDGERDVAGIVQWAKDELGLMPSVHEVRDVIATLGEHGFLDQAPATRVAAAERPAAAAAAASRETELAAGVVVGAQHKRPPPHGVDVELGEAGARAAAARPATPLPTSAEIDLGAPGAVAARPRAPVEPVALGAPGARTAAKPDVSLDLADHLPVKPADVKEAVRQSKQLQAVEVPKDLLAQADAPVPPPKVVEAPRRPATPLPVAPTPKPVERPIEAAKPTEPRPVEKARPVEKPVVAEKQPAKKPVAPRTGVSPVLIILLVLAVGGAGAYFAWRYLMRDKASTTVPPQGTGTVSQQPDEVPQPAIPPPPVAKFTIAPGVERDILAVFPGVVEQVDTTERDVDTSDVIVRLAGAKRLEGQLAAADKDIEKRQATFKAAQEARDKLVAPPAEGTPPKPPTEAQTKAAEAALTKAQEALEKRQEERQDIEDELEKLYVRAPFEGKVTILVTKGQKLDENVVAAKIVPAPAPTALFKMYKNMTIERGLTVPVRVGEQNHTCTVADSTVEGTRIVCPMAEGLGEGVEGTLLVEQAGPE